jgi:hypothetical protein
MIVPANPRGAAGCATPEPADLVRASVHCYYIDEEPTFAAAVATT